MSDLMEVATLTRYKWFLLRVTDTDVVQMISFYLGGTSIY